MSFNWDQYREFSQILTVVDSKGYSFHKDQHWVRITPKQFVQWIHFLHYEMNFFHLIDLHFMEVNERIELYYHFQNIEQHQRLNLVVEIQRDEFIPSVKDFYPAAEWMEIELVENLNHPFFGRDIIPFFNQGNENDRSLPKINFNPNRSEAPYPEESFVWEYWDIIKEDLNSASAAKICFNQDHVTGFHAIHGWHRQNWDHLLSESDHSKQLGLIDQINILSAPSYSILISRVYEDISNIKIPERAQAIRMILIELSRIVEHLSSLAAHCQDLGLSFESNLLLSCRERVFELYEKICGRRNGTFLSRIGGVSYDLPHGWNVEFIEIEKIFMRLLTTVRNQLRSSQVIRDQKNVGQITAVEAIRFGLTGPILRGSGINFDLRKSRPHYFYSDIEFDIPVGIYGTNFDRFLLRFEEIFESLRIIVQVIDNLPLGQFTLDTEEINDLLEKPLVNSFFTSFEAGQGELGIYYLRDGINKCLKLRTPSLTNAQALPIILNGVNRQYIKATHSLLGLSAREIDR